MFAIISWLLSFSITGFTILNCLCSFADYAFNGAQTIVFRCWAELLYFLVNSNGLCAVIILRSFCCDGCDSLSSISVNMPCLNLLILYFVCINFFCFRIIISLVRFFTNHILFETDLVTIYVNDFNSFSNYDSECAIRVCGTLSYGSCYRLLSLFVSFDHLFYGGMCSLIWFCLFSISFIPISSSLSTIFGFFIVSNHRYRGSSFGVFGVL